MIKKEVGFGLNSFGKQDILTNKETIAQLIENLLFLRPGQLPSMPFIGIDIYKYINPMIDDQELANLSERIVSQCSVLLPYMEFTGVTVKSMVFQNRPILLIIIPINVDGESETLLLGARKDTNGRVIFNYEFDDVLVT